MEYGLENYTTICNFSLEVRRYDYEHLNLASITAKPTFSCLCFHFWQEEKMLRYYEDEVRIMALRRERLPHQQNKAVS